VTLMNCGANVPAIAFTEELLRPCRTAGIDGIAGGTGAAKFCDRDETDKR